jgi:hypothetical protein
MSLRIRAAQYERLRLSAGAVRIAAAAALLLSACSTDNPLSLRPDVDIGERTASLAPDTSDIGVEPEFDRVEPILDPAEQPMPDYAADQPDTASAADSSDDGASAEYIYPQDDTPYQSVSLSAAEPGDGAAPEMGGGAATEEPDMASATTDMAGEDANGETIVPLSTMADDPSIVGPDATNMAGAAPAAPGVSEHHIDSLDQLNPVAAGAVDEVDPAEQDAPAEPYQIAALPRTDNPVSEPRNVMPADEVDCRAELKRLGVVYKDLPRISEGESCGIDYPVKVSAIGRVKMVPAATLRCEMAATVAAWTKKELIPAAKSRYLTGVKAIHQGSSYSCRNVRRSRTLSEHGKGNALDIARIELNSGRDIAIRKPGWFSFRQKGFLNSVRSDGCEYFTTVLGPGYDRDHRDHFHFDIKSRPNGHRACR